MYNTDLNTNHNYKTIPNSYNRNNFKRYSVNEGMFKTNNLHNEYLHSKRTVSEKRFITDRDIEIYGTTNQYINERYNSKENYKRKQYFKRR